MSDSFGKLPHRPFRHIPMHIVCRLHGSIPVKELKHIQRERIRLYRKSLAENLPDSAVDERYEILLEEALHQKSNGPYHLKDQGAAKSVIDAWKHAAAHRGIELYTVCVMSNHFHVLARSNSEKVIPPGPVMQSIKSYTARECHRILGTSGPFWARSYFDRDVRPGKFSTVMWYILNNPVQAGLVDDWEDWPHTYLNPEFDRLFRED